jgi:hypothetical protein
VDHPASVSRRIRLLVLALAAVTFLASLLIAGRLFAHQSANNDEAVYVFQAKTMAHGWLTLPAAPHADFFRPWMSGPHDGRQVLVFQPVFPATLALSEVLFGTMRIAVAAITAGCVLVMFAFARTAFGDDRVAAGSAAVMALSPLTLVHSGMYLEYLYAVLLELGVLTLVLRAGWGRTRPRLVGAGLLHGLLFCMRPLDALALGLVVVVLQLVPRPTSWRPALGRVAVVAAAAVPGVLATLAYNHLVTGHYLRFPLWAIGGKNDLGFGERWIVSGAPVIRFGWNDAWIAIRQNLRSFPHWLAGGVLAVPVGAYGLWSLRRARAFPALAALAVLFPLAYLFYWGNVLIVFGRRTIGPHYYLALLIPGSVAVAAGVAALGRRFGRPAALVTVAALAVATVVELPDKIDRNREVADRHRAEDDAIHDAVGEAQAVVVLPITRDGPYVMHPRGWLMNEPDLSNRVLYAADRLGENLALFDRFPDHQIWRFQSVAEGDDRRPDMARLTRVPVGAPRAVPVTIRTPAGSPVVLAHVSAGDQTATCVLSRNAVAGDTFRLTATIGPRSLALDCPTEPAEVALPDGPSTLAIGVAFGPNEDTGFSRLHEYRIWARRSETGTEVVTPAEQWQREPTPTFRWTVTAGDPAIDLTLG